MTNGFFSISRYFSIPYSLPKLDMVGVPRLRSEGMENYGLITYKETCLLYDELLSSSRDKQMVTNEFLVLYSSFSMLKLSFNQKYFFVKFLLFISLQHFIGFHKMLLMFIRPLKNKFIYFLKRQVQFQVADTVAHELAHQWFGNLVTMKWWTDLWLNEAFATWVLFIIYLNLMCIL